MRRSCRSIVGRPLQIPGSTSVILCAGRLSVCGWSRRLVDWFCEVSILGLRNIVCILQMRREEAQETRAFGRMDENLRKRRFK